MTHDAATRAGRLLARARRPALDPWALATIHEVDVERAPRFAAPALPTEPPPGLELPAGRSTVPPEPRADESAPKATTGAAPVAPPGPPGRSSPLRAVGSEPVSAGQRNGNALPGSSRPVPRAATTGADPPSRHVERALQSGWVAAAPASLRPVSRAPAEPDAERAQVLDPTPRPATANRPPEAPADSASSEATDSHPARHQPPMRVTPAVVAGEPAAPGRAAPGPPAPPPRQSSPSFPPSVVIDEIRIVTPPAAGPARDPLASLAAQRVGASRHRGGERWRA